MNTRPLGPTDQSALSYTGNTFAPLPDLLTSPQDLPIGSLFHKNTTIGSGSEITDVTLNLNFIFSPNSDGSNPFTSVANFAIEIDETPNNCTNPTDPPLPPGQDCSDDIITVGLKNPFIVPIPSSTKFIVVTPQFPEGNTIRSPEANTNTLGLFADFTEAPAPLPYGGIALLGLISKKISSYRSRLHKYHAD